jgi:AcrR family transcriptional regulator
MTAKSDVDGQPSTRERILVVATGLFRDAGYGGTSVADIGKRVGISGPALYHHFPDKRQILYQCCRRAMDQQIAEGRRALEHDDPAAQLRTFVIGDCLYQLGSLQAAMEYGSGAYTLGQLSHELPRADQRRIDQLRRGLYEILRTIIRSGVADGTFAPVDPTATSFAIFGMSQQTTAWFHPDGRLAAEELGEMYASFAERIVGVSPAAAG